VIRYRGYTRDRIRKIIMCARCMVDAVPAGARHPALQADDLGDEPIMARQGDVASVEQRQHVPEQIGLGLLADFVADAVPAERFLNELAAVMIANNLADAIALEQRGEIVDHRQWRERRLRLADSEAVFWRRSQLWQVFVPEKKSKRSFTFSAFFMDLTRQGAAAG